MLYKIKQVKYLVQILALVYVVRFKCLYSKKKNNHPLLPLDAYIVSFCPCFLRFHFVFVHSLFFLSTYFVRNCSWVNSQEQEFVFICSGYIEVLYRYRNCLSFPLLKKKVYFKNCIEDPVCITYLQITVGGYYIYIHMKDIYITIE